VYFAPKRVNIPVKNHQTGLNRLLTHSLQKTMNGNLLGCRVAKVNILK